MWQRTTDEQGEVKQLIGLNGGGGERGNYHGPGIGAVN